MHGMVHSPGGPRVFLLVGQEPNARTFSGGDRLGHGEPVVADPVARVVTEFAPLTLKRLGQAVRESMVTVRKPVHSGNLVLAGLLPVPHVSFCIDEAIVVNFARQDSVLSTAYARFRGSHLTQSILTTLARAPPAIPSAWSGSDISRMTARFPTRKSPQILRRPKRGRS